MATNLVIADRVKQLSTATGTGNLLFSSTVTGYRAFSAVVANGVPFPYAIKHQTLDEWEEGIGELTGGNTLIRRVLASSNSNNAVNFSAGNKEIALVRHSFIVGNECTVGTGEDGPLIITSSDVTLTDDTHYTTVSWGVGATGRLNTAGFVPHVLDEVDFTNAPAGAINNDAVGATGGGWGTVGGGLDGLLGGTATRTIALIPAVLGGKAGATDGTGFQVESVRRIGRLGPFASTCGVPGGGGGTSGSVGVPGGGGGGVVELRCRRLRRTSAAGTGAIRANGAAYGGGGNAAGGGGGRVRVRYYELLGSAKTGMLEANGGAGASASFDGGDGGTIETYNLSTGASTYVVGTTTTTATPGTCTANL